MRDMDEIQEMKENLQILADDASGSKKEQLDAKIAILQGETTSQNYIDEDADSMVQSAAADADEWLEGDDDMDLQRVQ